MSDLLYHNITAFPIFRFSFSFISQAAAWGGGQEGEKQIDAMGRRGCFFFTPHVTSETLLTLFPSPHSLFPEWGWECSSDLSDQQVWAKNRDLAGLAPSFLNQACPQEASALPSPSMQDVSRTDTDVGETFMRTASSPRVQLRNPVVHSTAQPPI